MITENLSTLKIHKLTQEQYDRELDAGRIDGNALYLTPEEDGYYVMDYSGNLLPFEDIDNGGGAANPDMSYPKTENGITIDYENGIFTLNGTCTSSKSFEITTRGVTYATLEAGQPYTIALNHISGEATKDANLFIGSEANADFFHSNLTNLNKVFDVDHVLTRFAINVEGGHSYTGYKVAPYVGQSFSADYVGGVQQFISTKGNPVFYNMPQDLSELEKTQARENIGAGSVKSVNGYMPDENGNVELEIAGGSTGEAVLYTAQDLSLEQQAQVRENIGAAELSYEIDYCGNMLPIDKVEDVYEKNGVTITHENGVFTLNGTCTISSSIELVTNGAAYAMTEAGKKYTTALVYISGNKIGSLNLFIGNGHDVYMPELAAANKVKTPAEGYSLTRFAFNFLTGVVFDNFKVAPYLGQNFIDSYVGGEKKQIVMATAESVAKLEEDITQLEAKINILPTQFSDERNRVIPIVQSHNADLRLIAFADPHSFDANKYRKYNDLLSSGCIDSIVGLGDYQSYSTQTRADTLKYITQSLNHAGRTPNCFYAIGNHDIAFTSPNSGAVSQDTVLTKKEMYDCTCRHLNGIANYNEADPYGCYYYVDYTAAKIRMIVLNTSDIYEADGSLAHKYTESVMIQQPQVTWLVEKALDFSGKTGWSVLVCCHSAFIRTMLTDILSAVKNGASLNKTWTFDRRLEDGADSVTITANKDFGSQGAVNVIGVLYGHDHHDITTVSNGIPFVGFISDNGKLDDYYVAKVNGLTAGGYCFTAKNGSKFGFTLTEDIADASVFGYNAYLMGLGNTTIRFQNADGVTVKETRAKTADYADGMTEITGFVQERTPGTIAEESCVVVNIDKDAREIRIVPYGVGENRVISY